MYDFSHKTWIFLLKSKTKVFIIFQEFRDLVENQKETHIWVLRSDNGGEFTSHGFDDFYQEVGIKRELIVSYKPQKNGVSKSKNRSIYEANKEMIHDQEFPMFLWAEATKTTVYIQNRSPRYILGNKTYEEAFFGVKPKVGIMMIFVFLVYIHVPKEKRSNMESPGRKGTFVRNSEMSKAYQIYIPS